MGGFAKTGVSTLGEGRDREGEGMTTILCSRELCKGYYDMHPSIVYCIIMPPIATAVNSLRKQRQ